jgi:hypothetical protein
MIEENSVEFFNSRLTYSYSDLKNLTPAQKDRVRNYGSQAENLLKNKDLAMFVHHFKFELADELILTSGYTNESNNEKIAIAHELKGIDKFITCLKRAVMMKNRVGNAEYAPEQN